MPDQPDLLAQFSNALATRAEAGKNAVVAIRLAHERHLTGLLWHSGVVVASEQSLPRKEEFELVAPGGAVVSAKIAGRDPSTNIAILRPAATIAAPSIVAGEARTGGVVLVIGADGTGGASARLGLVNLAGPEWHSSRGGLIDRRIVLDARLARREEGGPVFDATGGTLGMSTFGPRGQVIAIPTATIERVVPQLLKDGHIARGWLGVALTARRGAGCVARDRRPVKRPDGDVGGRGRPGGAGGNSGGRHHPQRRRDLGASPAKNRPAFRRRQHRAQGRASPDQGRRGDRGSDHHR